jgi:hypothetical protein
MRRDVRVGAGEQVVRDENGDPILLVTSSHDDIVGVEAGRYDLRSRRVRIA